MSDATEWISVDRTTKGTTVRVTLVEGRLAAKWAVKSFKGHIRESVIEARKAAYEALEELREAAS